jgi:signal transduction histidine kinase
VWRAWSQRPLPARGADRLLVAALLVWALFDVPWWWRPPGHGGSALAILSVLGLAAAQSVPFLWRRTQAAAVLALAGASLAVKYATHLNVWSAGAAVLAAAYGLGAYGDRVMRQVASAGDPRAASEAIAAIERQARGGLDELNVLVRELRPSGPAEPDLPRLGDLPGLVRRARESGLRAGLRVDGEARQLAAAVELAGYRVVQESLTNAIRYAPGAAATVHLAYRADGVMVDVVDDGPGTPTARTAGQGGGTGLAGLSERARLAGGWLEAGSGPEGGFVVRAFLPDNR